MGVNRGRVFLGGLAGGVVWTVWSFLTGYLIIGMARYDAATKAGLFLKEPRYHHFTGQWIVLLFISAIFMAYLYGGSGRLPARARRPLSDSACLSALSRPTLNFAQATWVPIDRMFPLGWMLDMWGGAILAALVAGWLYKD